MARFHSISNKGMAIFDRRIESLIGGVEVDLVSAPIAPGTHRLEIDTNIGGIEIYLPKYVAYSIDGGPVIGGEDIHDGFGLWSRFGRSIARLFGMKKKIPDRAVPNPTPDQPIRIELVIYGGIGGLDIYRLDEPPKQLAARN
ncbi:MAG TPA: hypothetical protein VH143_10735 [Kofleriaceae bacterium]|jgi:hypothetical protein|nr:hypothetical protein [Kofleriaceae bacterium]